MVVVVDRADVTDRLLKPIVESIGMLNRVDTVADVTVMVSVNIHNVYYMYCLFFNDSVYT